MQGNLFRSLPSLLIIISWICATRMEKKAEQKKQLKFSNTTVIPGNF